MFTNGLSTIQTDELHSYEEGIDTLGQVLVLEHGSPRQLERAMHRPPQAAKARTPVAIRFDDDAEVPTTRSFLRRLRC